MLWPRSSVPSPHFLLSCLNTTPSSLANLWLYPNTVRGISTAPNTASGRHTAGTREPVSFLSHTWVLLTARAVGAPYWRTEMASHPSRHTVSFCSPQHLVPASCPRNISLILALAVYSNPFPSPTPNLELKDLIWTPLNSRVTLGMSQLLKLNKYPLIKWGLQRSVRIPIVTQSRSVMVQHAVVFLCSAGGRCLWVAVHWTMVGWCFLRRG